MLATEKEEVGQFDIVRDHWLEIEKGKISSTFILLGKHI